MLSCTCKHFHVMCRLVEGTSLSDYVSNGLMPGSPATQEHEDKVLEIAAQLVQVCLQQFAGVICVYLDATLAHFSMNFVLVCADCSLSSWQHRCTSGHHKRQPNAAQG